MKKSPETSADEHREDLLLPYLEDVLAPELRAMFQAHIASCAQCSEQARETLQVMKALKDHQEVFCPDPWEIYEFVHYGYDPDSNVSGHLGECASCAQVARECSPDAAIEPMPSDTMKRLRARFPGRKSRELIFGEQPLSLVQRLLQRLRIPSLAVGAAVAAVLALVIIYPRDVPHPQATIGFSSVTWQKVPKPKALRTSGKRSAIVMVFKDFGQRMPQQQIDAFYEAAAPTMDVYELFQLLSPAEVTQALKSEGEDGSDRAVILHQLKSKLDVGLAVLVTVTFKGKDRVDLETESIDTGTGTVFKRHSEGGLALAQLEHGIRESVLGLLLSTDTGSESKPQN